LDQIPTTLLAVVDASVGGKTAVDTPAGKNLIGAFHQPRGVFVDLSALHTLSARQVCNGFAEIVKIAATSDADLFSLLESHLDELISSTALSIHGELLFRVVGRACALKADVVQQDEREGGIRAILNFGHSIGHAIEALQPSLSSSSQTNSLLHGECVAIGMIAEARLAVARQNSGVSALSHADLDRLIACLNGMLLHSILSHSNLSTYCLLFQHLFQRFTCRQ
jgi:3-dehydroquinate synthetase